MTPNFINQFSAQLDKLLGITAKVSNSTEQHVDAAIEVASLLAEMDFDAELAPRADIRSRWIRQTQKLNRSSSPGYFTMLHWKWVVTFIVIILLALFYKPVFAAVSRALGYVYVPDVGFVARDSALLMKQPVFQEHEGQTVTVTHGVATVKELTLFLEFNDVARPVDGAWLETSSGQRLKLSYWEYYPNVTDSHGIKMIFPPLAAGIQETTLSLPEGWHLPLEWIPVLQSQLPDVRSVPFVETQVSVSSSDLCVEQHGMKFCVLAATGSGENTLVLVKAESRNPDLIPGDMTGLLTWQTENAQVALQDEQGNVFPMSSEQDGTLTFPALPVDQKVTLTVPALLATVDIPDQNIVLDMGDNPQPGTIIPLDVNVQILGATVHFSNATFVGDGVNSLRLTLNADDPIQTVDGVTPILFELGKPDRVDDLYGSGTLNGSKDIFVELVRPSGKITGMLTIPIIRATVAINGPFQFNFNISDASSPTPAPAEVDPNNFSPAPTPTTLPLDDYSYKGEILSSGDLIFTVFNGKNSELYAFTPGLDSRPRLVATLPGAVAQVYIHPDTQGIDYLAGSQEFRDDFNYVDNLRLYGLRFAEGRPPRLLYSFTPNPQDLVGTAVEGSWSYDGRYAIFRYAKSIPGNNAWKFLWMDMACPASEDCVPHEIVLDPNLELFKAYFAPADYRILFTGSDTSGTGEPDLFMLDFDPEGTNTDIVNLTSNSSSFAEDVGVSPAVWTPDGSIFTLCHDRQMSTLFCSVDPKAGNIISGASYTEHIFQYQLSLSGKEILAVVINHDAPGKGILEIHLFDLNGNASPAFATGRMFNVVILSPSEQHLAYVPEYSDQLNLIDLISGKTVQLYTSDGRWAISWAGWVN